MIIFTSLFALKNSLNTDKSKQSYMRSLQDEIRIDSRFAWKELKDEQMIAQVRNLALDAKMLNTDLQENCEVRLYGKDYPWNALNKIARNDTKSHTFILMTRGGSRILRRGGGANIPFLQNFLNNAWNLWNCDLFWAGRISFSVLFQCYVIQYQFCCFMLVSLQKYLLF